MAASGGTAAVTSVPAVQPGEEVVPYGSEVAATASVSEAGTAGDAVLAKKITPKIVSRMTENEEADKESFTKNNEATFPPAKLEKAE